MAVLAADVMAFATSVTPRKFVLLGHGLGSIVAHTVASFWPRWVSSVIALGSCPSGSGSTELAKLGAALDAPGFELSESFLEDTLRLLGGNAAPPADFAKTTAAAAVSTPLRVWRSALSSVLEDDHVSHLADARMPVLVMSGSQDCVLPADSCGRPLAKALVASRLVIIDGAGHGLNWEMPERVGTEINQFLLENLKPRMRNGIGLVQGMPIYTKSREAQRVFDDGFRLLNILEYLPAIDFFRYCARLDPNAPMCLFGEAYSYKPPLVEPVNLNWLAVGHNTSQRGLAIAERVLAQAESEAASNVSANSAAMALLAKRDYMMLRALVKRYSSLHPSVRDVPLMNRAYAEALSEAVALFPNDADLLYFAGEAWLSINPWLYWHTDRLTPTEHADKSLSYLHRSVEIKYNMTGALHMLIHLYEPSKLVDTSVPFSDRLLKLIRNGADHLLHICSHALTHVGAYAEATSANAEAVGMPLGEQRYQYHNLEALVWGARLGGDRESAHKGSARMVELTNVTAFCRVGEAGWYSEERFLAQQMLTFIFFKEWSEIEALSSPPAHELLYTVAVWYFARGMAAAHGHGADPVGWLRLLRAQAAAVEAAPLEFEYGNLKQLVRIYENVMLGALLLDYKGDAAGAVSALRHALALQEALWYDEPYPLYRSVRPALAEALLRNDQQLLAISVLRDDLVEFPNQKDLLQLCEELDAPGCVSRDADGNEIHVEFPAEDEDAPKRTMWTTENRFAAGSLTSEREPSFTLESARGATAAPLPVVLVVAAAMFGIAAAARRRRPQPALM